MGVYFYIAKPILLISVTIISQAVLCSTIQQRVKYEDSQHSVGHNL